MRATTPRWAIRRLLVVLVVHNPSELSVEVWSHTLDGGAERACACCLTGARVNLSRLQRGAPAAQLCVDAIGHARSPTTPPPHLHAQVRMPSSICAAAVLAQHAFCPAINPIHGAAGPCSEPGCGARCVCVPRREEEGQRRHATCGQRLHQGREPAACCACVCVYPPTVRAACVRARGQEQARADAPFGRALRSIWPGCS